MTTNQTTNSIKPCPFCGSKDIKFVSADENSLNPKGYMSCWVCCGNINHYEDAIKAWNTRPSPLDQVEICKKCWGDGVFEYTAPRWKNCSKCSGRGIVLKRRNIVSVKKCHFTTMETCSSDYETWLECKHCGHTVFINQADGER